MKLQKPMRYLKQHGTNFVYVWTEHLAQRPDMIEFVPEPKPEPKPEPNIELKPEPKSTPFKIEKAKRADAGE